MGDWGLVLAGGGGKGSYQMGVWKFLCEQGFAKMFRGFSGTSVGALNAALFAQGDPGKAEWVWQSITQDVVLSDREAEATRRELAQEDPRVWERLFKTAEKSATLAPMVGPLLSAMEKVTREISTIPEGRHSRRGLSQIIEENLDCARLRALSPFCYATCFPLPTLQQLTRKPDYINLADPELSDEQVRGYLLASSAYPFVFPMEKVDGQAYYDGGISDNVPLRPLYERTNLRNFLVVHLKPGKRLDANDFPDVRMVQMGPEKDLGRTMNFDPEVMARNIELGYEDMKKALPRIL